MTKAVNLIAKINGINGINESYISPEDIRQAQGHRYGSNTVFTTNEVNHLKKNLFRVYHTMGAASDRRGNVIQVYHHSSGKKYHVTSPKNNHDRKVFSSLHDAISFIK